MLKKKKLLLKNKETQAEVYPALVQFDGIWIIKFHWRDKFLLCSVTDQNISFLVPDSSRATVTNGNSIREDTIKNY